MGFDVSGLANYVNQESRELLVPALYKKKTATYAVKQFGIKTAANLQLLDDSLYLQDGSSCGFTATGTTTFTKRALTVGDVTINKQWCLKDLEAKWTQLLLGNGAAYTEADMPQAITTYILSLLGQTLETADWQGDLTSGNPNLNKYDGIKTIISAAATATDANVAAYTDGAVLTSWTSTSVIKGVDALIKAMVANKPGVMAKPGKKLIFVPREVYVLYVIANRTANYNFFNGTAGQNMDEMPALGYSDVFVVATDGLNGTNDAYMMHESNLYLGADGESDEDTFRIWYSLDDDVVRMRVDFKRGWQIAYPNEVTYILL